MKTRILSYWVGRLPNGTATSSKRTYVDTWREFCDVITRALPGWKRHGYDPGVSMERDGSMHHFTTDVAQRIVDMQLELEALRGKAKKS